LNVQAGDILCFRVGPKSSILDHLIGWGEKIIGQAPTKAEFCHVGILGGPSGTMIYEAIRPCVHVVPMDWPARLARNPIEVFRIKGITPAQINTMMGYAAAHVGDRYDTLSIYSFGLLGTPHSVVCSQYVWWCARAAGYTLCKMDPLDKNAPTPDDIAASDFIERIPPLFV
jgi:hypothetical protein